LSIYFATQNPEILAFDSALKCTLRPSCFQQQTSSRTCMQSSREVCWWPWKELPKSRRKDYKKCPWNNDDILLSVGFAIGRHWSAISDFIN